MSHTIDGPFASDVSGHSVDAVCAHGVGERPAPDQRFYSRLSQVLLQDGEPA